MALDFLAGLFGGGSSEPTITQIPAATPDLPNLPALNSIAQHRIYAGSPWTYGPYRAMDYVRGVQATPNMIPQMHQMMGGGMGGQHQGMMGGQMGMGGMNPQQLMQGMFPSGGNGYMGNFQQPNPGLMQPQYSPIAWAMGLGQMFSQLNALYQQQMQGGGGQMMAGGGQQNSQQPLTREQPQQPQQGGNA